MYSELVKAVCWKFKNMFWWSVVELTDGRCAGIHLCIMCPAWTVLLTLDESL